MRVPNASLSGTYALPRLAAAALVPVALAACEPSPPDQTGEAETPPAAVPAPGTGAPEAAQPPTAEQTVTIVVTDDSVTVTPTTLRPGSTTFEVTNRTSVPYDVDIDGPGPDGEIEQLQPGETRTLTMTLRAGKYEVESSAEEGPERERKTRITVRS